MGDVNSAQGPVDETVLCFRRGADAYCASRLLGTDTDLVERLQRVLEVLVAGPTPSQRAANVWSAIPQGAELAKVVVDRGRVSIYLELPEMYLKTEFDPLLSDQLVEQIAKTLRPFRSELMAAAHIQAGAPDDRLIVHVLVKIPGPRPIPSATSPISSPNRLWRKSQEGESLVRRDRETWR